MNIRQRTYLGRDDLPAMLVLAQATAPANLHVTDLPYRFSSWAFDQPATMALWHDLAGELVAWAALQTPFWAWDYVYRPDQPELHPQILAWADKQAKQLVDTSSGRPCWFVNVFSEQLQRRTELEQMGFACQADVGENAWSKVFMARPRSPLTVPSLPPGFTIRPLAGAAEVAAYVALHQAVFQSKNMTEPWRHRTLQQPAYRPDLDLVVVAPNGQLAAFCIGWVGQQQATGQIEPLGVHENYRSQGLGHALLAEAVRRLQQLDAQTVYVETDNYRNAAFALYEAMGFQVVKEVLVYRKDYGG